MIEEKKTDATVATPTKPIVASGTPTSTTEEKKPAEHKKA